MVDDVSLLGFVLPLWGMQKNHPPWTMNARIKAFFLPSWMVLWVCFKNRQNISKHRIPLQTPIYPKNPKLHWFIMAYHGSHVLCLDIAIKIEKSGDFLGWLWPISQAHDKRDWTALPRKSWWNDGEIIVKSMGNDGKWLGSLILSDHDGLLASGMDHMTIIWKLFDEYSWKLNQASIPA